MGRMDIKSGNISKSIVEDAALSDELEQMMNASLNLAPFGSRTDVGYVREHNEDSLLVTPPLFVVCDGMGGHEAGEIASEVAVGTLASRMPRNMDVEALGRVVEEANLQIIKAGHEGRGREGMGTTCTAAMVEGEKLIIAQVGDSRAYLLHDGNLQQLTRDHSVVADLIETGQITKEEARTHKWRSFITRALGLDAYVKPDLYEINVTRGDRLLLCTDGLYSMVEDDSICDIMQSTADPQRCADKLVEAALDGGGTDNITVIVVDIVGHSARHMRKFAANAKVTAIVIIALMVALICGTAALFASWASNTAYIADVDGKVAIYKGMPGSFAGIEFSRLEEVTNVELSKLQPGVATRMKEGQVRCDSVDGARKLVKEYEESLNNE